MAVVEALDNAEGSVRREWIGKVCIRVLEAIIGQA